MWWSQAVFCKVSMLMSLVSKEPKNFLLYVKICRWLLVLMTLVHGESTNELKFSSALPYKVFRLYTTRSNEWRACSLWKSGKFTRFHWAGTGTNGKTPFHLPLYSKRGEYKSL